MCIRDRKISDLENVNDFDEMITPSDELINAFQFMLKDIGEDKNRDGLKNTPRRAAAAFKFLNHGYKLNVDKIVNNALFNSDLEDMVMYMKGLRPEYKEKSKAKFRVVGRERFPTKTYSTTPANLNVKYLPSGSSFYSIKDAETDDVIVPYGTGSCLSCDSSGNYFNLWMDGYQPERYYTIEYRIRSGSGTVEEVDQYFDEGFTFKVSL